MAATRLAEANGICIQLEQQIRSLAGRRHELLRRNAGDGSLDLEYLQSRERHASLLEQQVESAQNILAEKEMIRDRVREEYNEALRKKQVLERVREHQEREHHKEALKQETEVLDEIGGMLYTRQGD